MKHFLKGHIITQYYSGAQMTRTRWIIIVVLVTMLIVLVLQNTSVVTVKLLFWEISMSQVILVPIIFALGFIVGATVILLRERKKREA